MWELIGGGGKRARLWKKKNTQAEQDSDQGKDT